MDPAGFKHPNEKDAGKPGRQTRAQSKEGTLEAHFSQESM